MSKGQVIRLNGDVVALVVGGEARITDGLSEPAMLTVKGMCLFAMEVQTGAIDPPYTDDRAMAYVRLADHRRAGSAERR